MKLSQSQLQNMRSEITGACEGVTRAMLIAVGAGDHKVFGRLSRLRDLIKQERVTIDIGFLEKALRTEEDTVADIDALPPTVRSTVFLVIEEAQKTSAPSTFKLTADVEAYAHPGAGEAFVWAVVKRGRAVPLASGLTSLRILS